MSDEKTVLGRGARMRNKQLILVCIFVALSLSSALAQEAVPVMVNDVLALRFVSDDSEAFVYFKKYKDEDAFAIQVSDWQTLKMKSGWIYITVKLGTSSCDICNRQVIRGALV